MKKFMLIGGGEVGRGNTSYETKIIDEEIVKMTEKENPNFLFVGLASNFSDSYYDTMKKIYQELGCHCMYLKKKNIINNPNIVKNKIDMADIIYFCGGDTLKLLKEVKTYHLDILLQQAANRGVVLAGMSAGAILLCEQGYSDSYKLQDENNDYQFIEGLSLIPFWVCPHYEIEKERAIKLKEELRNKTKVVLALENGVSAKIMDNDIEIITSIPDRKAYYCYYKGNKYYQEVIK